MDFISFVAYAMPVLQAVVVVASVCPEGNIGLGRVGNVSFLLSRYSHILISYRNNLPFSQMTVVSLRIQPAEIVIVIARSQHPYNLFHVMGKCLAVACSLRLTTITNLCSNTPVVAETPDAQPWTCYQSVQEEVCSGWTIEYCCSRGLNTTFLEEH